MPPQPAPPTDAVPSSSRASHVLRPHHILLLWILRTGIYNPEDNAVPQKFALTLHRLLLDEISEVKPPRSYWDLLADIKKASASDYTGNAKDLVQAMSKLPHAFRTPNDLADFMKSLTDLFQDTDDDEDTLIDFKKLSIAAAARLHGDFFDWLKFKADARFVTPPGYAPIRKDLITNDYQIFKTKFDRREYATTETYALFMKGVITGDSNIANEGLRRFFEQRFHEGSDSGLRQHAMLNLARMYYLRREVVACRKTLEEAVTTARTAGDNATLQHCTSLLHRLPLLPTERGKKPIINEIQPQMHPLEILHDAKKLLRVEHQQPLTAAYEKVMQAIGLYDHYIDVQGGLFMESEQYAQHAVQSIIWNFFGCSELARIEEDIVSSFTEYGSDDNTRLTVTLNRAYYFCDREYQWDKEHNIGSLIRDPLHEVFIMRVSNFGMVMFPLLLTALWHAEYQGRYGLYRTAVVMLADVGLEFGMTKWCRRILDEVMPQIMSENDLEQKGYALYTLARCVIAAGDSSAEALRESIRYLEEAERCFTELEMFSALMDVQFMLSVVHHNLDDATRRDEVAERHEQTRLKRDQEHATVVEEWIEDTLQLVADIGAAIASK
ncbi:hypothetical protein BN946_scf184798.g125 [Trametes cinnabarina]|uniref:Anaphase-promoting complex subunit 5 n=1 Tax=Pycnoporus cinnabarinus TaxID=5643 RepID=A0A060SF15_PYCCI|nr:hypothetical protein BN946_scf184798.g125 [Trametes cinnabarina]